MQHAQPSGGLKPPEAASVRFIDYEWVLYLSWPLPVRNRGAERAFADPVRHATYCPAAFELANHFSEWAGFECDYDLLPAKATRRDFIREYLQAHSKLKRGEHLQGSSDESAMPPERHQVAEAEVNELMDEVDSFRGFPGFYW